jgi:hypothetical protein
MAVTSRFKHLKSAIEIQATPEVCYKVWIDAKKLPKILERVIGVEIKTKPENTKIDFITSVGEIDQKVHRVNLDLLPTSEIKHWLLSGPGGHLYKIENTTVFEIPDRFYCTVSTDQNDASVQSYVTFFPDTLNRHTVVEWEIWFWRSSKKGSATRLVSDIADTGDSFMADCLSDLKRFIER